MYFFIDIMLSAHGWFVSMHSPTEQIPN